MRPKPNPIITYTIGFQTSLSETIKGLLLPAPPYHLPAPP